MLKVLTTAILSVWLLAGLAAPRAAAQINTGTPKELEGINVDEKLDAQLPLDLRFVESDGVERSLGEYFKKDRPVILTLNYYGCPMLCGLMLNGVLDALRELPWTPGQEYEIVTLSFDPLEAPPLAAAKKENYISTFARPGAARGWHFLTGKSEAIHALCLATGFKFRWNAGEQQWAHPAVAIICTPDGRISRYLGLPYDPETMRLSLVEAGEGRIGSLWDRIFLSCYQYTAHQGRYTPNVMAIMRIAGFATVLMIAILIVGSEMLRRRLRAAAAHRAAPSPSH